MNVHSTMSSEILPALFDTRASLTSMDVVGLSMSKKRQLS